MIEEGKVYPLSSSPTLRIRLTDAVEALGGQAQRDGQNAAEVAADGTCRRGRKRGLSRLRVENDKI